MYNCSPDCFDMCSTCKCGFVLPYYQNALSDCCHGLGGICPPQIATNIICWVRCPGLLVPIDKASLHDCKMWAARERTMLRMNPNLVAPVVYDTMCGLATDMFLDKDFIHAHATIARMLMLAPMLKLADVEDDFFISTWTFAVWELAKKDGDYEEIRKFLDMHIACECLRRPDCLKRQHQRDSNHTAINYWRLLASLREEFKKKKDTGTSNKSMTHHKARDTIPSRTKSQQLIPGTASYNSNCSSSTCIAYPQLRLSIAHAGINTKSGATLSGYGSDTSTQVNTSTVRKSYSKSISGYDGPGLTIDAATRYDPTEQSVDQKQKSTSAPCTEDQTGEIMHACVPGTGSKNLQRNNHEAISLQIARQNEEAREQRRSRRERPVPSLPVSAADTSACREERMSADKPLSKRAMKKSRNQTQRQGIERLKDAAQQRALTAAFLRDTAAAQQLKGETTIITEQEPHTKRTVAQKAKAHNNNKHIKGPKENAMAMEIARHIWLNQMQTPNESQQCDRPTTRKGYVYCP